MWGTYVQSQQALICEHLRHKYKSRSAASTKEEAAFVRGQVESEKNKDYLSVKLLHH